jgi:hypothetical protein
LEELFAQANFPVRLPAIPSGFTLERVLRQPGPMPAFTVAYRHGPQFMYVTMWKDIGLRPVEEAHGIPVPAGGLRGRLVISPTLSTYSVTVDGAMYIFTSNLPFDEMVASAASLARSQPHAAR